MFTAQGPQMLCFRDSKRFSTLEVALVHFAKVKRIVTKSH